MALVAQSTKQQNKERTTKVVSQSKMKTRRRNQAEAIYEAECKFLGHRAAQWPTHEEDCIEYWEEIIKLGQEAWWKRKRSSGKSSATNTFIN
jgi:hypothetical protein